MKKNSINKRIKVKADLNQNSEQSEENSNEKEKENEITHENDSTTYNTYRCPNCFSIPIINVKDNENKVIIDCLHGHHIEMLFSEYMTNEFQKNTSKLICSQCREDKNSKRIMRICFECKKLFCKDCLSSHNKSNPNHHLNTIDKADINCPLHKSKYTYFCSECKKNLCDECVKEKNDGHQLIYFQNINLKNHELTEIKNNLEKENQILFKIKKIFNDTLVTLSNKFNDIMSYKFLCLKYKNNIINTYETKDTNYQIIDNVNHLKFITKDLKIEPEMNELDIIYELFNFLDSIEYNDENNNGNANDNNNNNNINNNDTYHINNSYSMNENNKIIIDTKNKIEESEHEDDIESEKENISNENNNKFSSTKNIKVEENEKDDDEDDKREEESDIIRNKIKTKNEYIKITDNNDNENEDNDNDNDNEKEEEKPEETENSNEINRNINNKVNKVTSSNDDLVNQVTPNKITKKVIVKKVEKMEEEKENNNDEDDEIKEENESNKNEKNKIKNDMNDNNEVSESLLNDNESDMYIYKSTPHIPVAGESTLNLGEKDKLSRTEKNIEDILENKEKEPKKRKKKVVKKKKIKQIIQQVTQDDIESEPKTTKTKKKVIKRARTKDKLIKKEEKVEDENDKKEEPKAEPKEEKDEESKEEYTNSNMRIEVNENDSNNQINTNIHIEDNENDKNEKEENNDEDISNDDITDNYDVSKTEDEKEDDLSNENKLEEVSNTNYEEFKENRSVKKKVKHVKKKKKKKLNIAKHEPAKEQNPKIEIINTENKKEKNLIYNNNPKIGMKIESLRYGNHDDGEPENIDNQEKTIERHIEKHIEVITDINNDEDDKSKNSKSSKKNKKITIKKRLNRQSSDKEEDDDDENKTKKKSKSKVSININTDINEKDNSVDNDMKRKINKLNKIVNMNLKLDNEGSLDNSHGSQRVKKRKKIKKKKYLICVDNNGKNITQNPEEEKQLKVTKTTTLIRSRSKEKPPRNENSQESSPFNKDKIVKNKEINFKIFEDGDDSSNYNDENSTSNKKKEITNIRTKKNISGINKIKKDLGSKFEAKGSRKMRMAQGKNNAAFLLENQTEVYFEEKNIIKAKNKGLDTFEIQYDREALNRSVDGYNSYKNRRKMNGYDYDYDEMKYLIERSNSYKKMKNYKKFNEREKINCMKFENGISCLLEINPTIFAIGNLIGDIIVINSHTYKEMQVIREHDGTIISLCLLHDKSILSCSADRKMLKIRTNQDGTKYKIEFIFTGYENYILKGIELMNTFKIITCSWDDKLFVWERIDDNNYKNSLIFNEGERVVDLLEINVNHFVSISENNELKIWSTDTCEMIDTIKNIKCIGAPNALCKITDFVICVLDYHEIQLIDIMEHRLINKISVDDGNLSCIIKLNDNSILLAEDFNNDKYCVFYMKQFYYEFEDFKPISYKKDKFFKTNKNNDKEIRALVQFSNGVIVQGVTGEYNGNDSGDLFFYY